ncbi:hypothetical protein MD484_g7423, partial [Candolleomyces efflorescens]
MAATLAVAAAPPPSLQESVRLSTVTWQKDLQDLFKHAKDRFPDVVWELVGEDDDEMEIANGMVGIGAVGGDRVSSALSKLPPPGGDEVWGHKAIVYARAPPSFQNRYFSFRPNNALEDDETYPVESTVSLGIPPSLLISRSPSPSPAPTTASSALLRITTSINPALFSNELEYLYTGQGFGEAFEFLFDSSENNHLLIAGVGEDGEVDAEALRIDKLRKDLVFMWRSRLYSDVRIALTGNFSSSNGSHQESTTAIFSSHRFILVSRCPYFRDLLLNWPTNNTKNATANDEPPTLTLPSPPFTPASLHFTLGYIYTGTLVFSHRSYDLSTAFAILRSSLYLGLTTLHDEVQARVVQEMCHGLFHAFLPFPEYEKVTRGKWGIGGCRCRQCARRAPRILEFSLEEDVHNQHLERGGRRALVGMFGEGWCTQEFAGLNQRVRESLVKGVGKRTTVGNVFALLWASENALERLGKIVEPWGDTVREMIYTARKTIDETLARESDACFGSENEDWSDIMLSGGDRFGDLEKVEWAMAAVLRGLKDSWAATLYQSLVSNILLRPSEMEEREPMLPATSSIRGVVEETRMEVLRWIGRKWIGIRAEKGFDTLEGWAVKEISDHIEVPIDDLLNPNPTHPTSGGSHRNSPARPIGAGRKSGLGLRPMSQHPHTSRIDADSDASSMRASVLTRNLPPPTGSSASTHSTLSSTTTGTGASRRTGAGTGTGRRTPTRGAADNASIRSSVSTRTFESAQSGSTVGRNGAVKRRVPLTVTNPSILSSAASTASGVDAEDSPAKKLAASVRARNHAATGLGVPSLRNASRGSLRERPDSKLTPEATSSTGIEGDKDDDKDGYEDDDVDRDSLLDDETESVLGSGKAGDDEGEGEGDTQQPQQEEGEEEDEDQNDDSTPANSTLSHTTTGSKAPHVARGPRRSDTDKTPVKKTLITKASLASFAFHSLLSPLPLPPCAFEAYVEFVGVDDEEREHEFEYGVDVYCWSGCEETDFDGQRKDGEHGYEFPNCTFWCWIFDYTHRDHSTDYHKTEEVECREYEEYWDCQDDDDHDEQDSVGPRRSPAVSTTSRKNAGAPPVPPIDPSKLSASASVGPGKPGAVKAPSMRSAASDGSTVIGSGTAGTTKKVVVEKKRSMGALSTKKSLTSTTQKKVTVVEDVKGKTGSAEESEVKEDVQAVPAQDKENIQPPTSTGSSPVKKVEDLPASQQSSEHRKTSSSASTSSVSSVQTVKRRGSVDTITSSRTGGPPGQRGSTGSGGSGSTKSSSKTPLSPGRKPSPPLPPVPLEDDESSIGGTRYDDADDDSYGAPRGATLDIGIPCIISSKRKRFKAYARYIGEVAGEEGSWVGVEVPLQSVSSFSGSGDSWGDRSAAVYSSMSMSSAWPEDDRQWNDGSWGGIRYFEIVGSTESNEWGDDSRASRRRRVDGGSAGAGAMWGSVPSSATLNGKGSLKREGDVMSMSLERMMKRQVLYVVDALGADL